jgi:hypothetical protein
MEPHVPRQKFIKLVEDVRLIACAAKGNVGTFNFSAIPAIIGLVGPAQGTWPAVSVVDRIEIECVDARLIPINTGNNTLPMSYYIIPPFGLFKRVIRIVRGTG